jgi:hypothetical protein
VVHGLEAGAVPAGDQERAVAAEDERPRAVGQIEDGEAGGLRLTQEHQAARRIHRLEAVRRIGRVPRDPGDGGVEVLVGGRVIAGRPVVQQVVPVHDVEEIDVPVVQEVGVQGEAEQAVVSPVPHLLAEIDQGCRMLRPVRVDDPDPAGLFPGIEVPRAVERDAEERHPIRRPPAPR